MVDNYVLEVTDADPWYTMGGGCWPHTCTLILDACMEAYTFCIQVAWEIWVIFLKYLIFTLGTKINILEIPNDKLGWCMCILVNQNLLNIWVCDMYPTDCKPMNVHWIKLQKHYANSRMDKIPHFLEADITHSGMQPNMVIISRLLCITWIFNQWVSL